MSYEKEALYYNSLSNKEVKCSLCPHNCNIKEDKLGYVESDTITMAYFTL